MDISIPQGSIKCYCVKHDGKYYIIFQFQMVRLKIAGVYEFQQS